MAFTTDPNNPDLCRTVDSGPVDQCEVYLVLSDEELSKGYVRPYRDSYVHDTCGTLTKMSSKLAETYAANPKFYTATYCVGCKMHLAVSEFTWDGTNEKVGS